MNSLEYKSTGALIDEYLTAKLKCRARPSDENWNRLNSLQEIVEKRVTNCSSIQPLYEDLFNTLKDCWEAQELIMFYKNADIMKLSEADLFNLADAALGAQKTNAKRCKLVREIDAVLGESDRTYLEKTYA